MRDTDPLSFRQTAAWVSRRPAVNRDQVFIALLEAIIDRQADLLERISKETEELSQRIFTRVLRAKESENNLREAIFRLGRSGDLIARERECIVALSRLVQFAGHEDFDDDGSGTDDAAVSRASSHCCATSSPYRNSTGFLSSKVSFMLDATLGLINIEQNSIVKIFTVAAVIFLPPTLVASLYGMNFDFMPELRWKMGYPFSLMLMVISVLLPLLVLPAQRLALGCAGGNHRSRFAENETRGTKTVPLVCWKLWLPDVGQGAAERASSLATVASTSSRMSAALAFAPPEHHGRGDEDRGEGADDDADEDDDAEIAQGGAAEEGQDGHADQGGAGGEQGPGQAWR